MLRKIGYVADYEGRSVNSHVLVLIRESIRKFEDDMLTFLRDAKKDVLDAIKDKKVIDDAVSKALDDAVAAFKQGWKA